MSSKGNLELWSALLEERWLDFPNPQEKQNSFKIEIYGYQITGLDLSKLLMLNYLFGCGHDQGCGIG